MALDIRSVQRDNGGACRHVTARVVNAGKEHVVATTIDEIDAVELSPEEVRRETLRALKAERVEGKDIFTERRAQVASEEPR